jgi:hypothetical protein
VTFEMSFLIDNISKLEDLFGVFNNNPYNGTENVCVLAVDGFGIIQLQNLCNKRNAKNLLSFPRRCKRKKMNGDLNQSNKDA